MRTKLFIFVFTLFFTFTIHSQYISSYKTGLFNGNHQTWLYNNTVYSYYNSLQLNQVIKYGFHMDHDGYGREGGFFDQLISYQSSVSGLIHELVINNNQQVFIEREKILRPAYGQQSDYQAEMENPESQYPGYGWLTRRGQTYSETWQGESVQGIKTGEPDNNGGWILMNLYENWEQINQPAQGSQQDDNYSHGYYLSDNKLTNPPNQWKWYILPRMRINQTDADLDPPKLVVTIEIYGYNSVTPISSVDIYSDNFKNQSGQYNGDYIDKYNNIQGGYISVLARELNQGNNTLSDGRSENPSDSHVDYRIKWHGEVNVWIDRVRVEDEWAHSLFTDPNGTQSNLRFHQRITEEASGLSNDPFFFYQDEFHYNMVPCIAAVDSIIKLSNPNNGLISLVNDWWWSEASGLKHAPPDFSHYVDRVMPPALMVSSYPFDDYVMRIVDFELLIDI